MTDFEVAILANEFLNSLQGRIETYLTGLFAMLVTSHFVASRLSRSITALVIRNFVLTGGAENIRRQRRKCVGGRFAANTAAR